jgi:alanine dehydrogenase
LNELRLIYGDENVEYILSTDSSIEESLKESDLVVGAVYVIGKQAPKVVKNSMLEKMKPGAVMVDISIDQGGCFETARPTTHADPTYVVDGVVHYCVANMPGAVAKTATMALTNATLPYIMRLASNEVGSLLVEDKHFGAGLNIVHGQLTHRAVAEALGRTWTEPDQILRTSLHLKSA